MAAGSMRGMFGLAIVLLLLARDAGAAGCCAVRLSAALLRYLLAAPGRECHRRAVVSAREHGGIRVQRAAVAVPRRWRLVLRVAAAGDERRYRRDDRIRPARLRLGSGRRHHRRDVLADVDL